MSYYTKITSAGLAAITAAMNNSSKVPITYMAFGDGNGYIPEPDENATSLVNEVYRVGVNKVEVHSKNPNWLVCEAIIPSAVGGFNIREVALYDSTGNTMLAIASYPPTYKPTVEEGAAKIQTIRIVIQVDNTGNFELIIDPDVVLATAQYVQDEVFKGQSNVSVKQYGAKGDGLHDDHLALQNNATAMDLDQLTYMFIPCRQESYLLKDTVVINMPSMIFGNRAATYYRGVGKKGYIIVDSEGPAFDLGGDKNTAERLGNPADQWTVKNIGFIPHPDQLPLTKVAIQHSAKTNGPDRGFILEEVSGSKLKNVLHIKDHGIQTQLATLVVEKCTISNNSIAILADGNVFGAKIVGNQIEQNSSGCIHGVFHAALTIHDNMLEGSGNTIYIKDHNIDRNGCDLSLEGNYFELNYGDYLIKMDSYRNTIFSKGNYVSGFLSNDGITPNTNDNRPRDHFLLTNTYTMVYIYDALSVTFYGSASLLEKNNLDKYLLYVEPSEYFKEIGLYKDINRLENNSYLTKNIGNKVLTELGEIYVLGTSGTYINSKLLSSANDILEINASFFSNSDEDYIQYLTVIDTNNNVYLSQNGLPGVRSEGKIKNLKYIFVVPSNVNNKTLRYKIDNLLANTDMKIIGFSEKKIGVYTPNTANKLVNRFIISKSKPKLLKVGETIEYPLDINEQLITSGQSISIDFELAGLNDLFTIKTYFKNAALNTNFELSHSYITNGLRINIKNKSTGELTLPANTIGIKVKEF